MKKKLVVITLGAALSFALLTGCGAPSTKDVVDGMYDATIDSANMNVKFDVDLSAKIGDDTQSVKANADLDMAMTNMNDLKDALAHIDGSFSYDAIGFLKGSQDFEAYASFADDECKVYVEQDGSWYTTSTEMPATSNIDEEAQKKLNDAAKEVWYKATMDKKTEKVGDVECYVLSLSTTLNDYMPAIQVAIDEADAQEEWDELTSTLEDEYDVKLSDIFDCIKVDSKAYVSKADKYMVAYSVDFAGVDVEKLLELADTSWEDLGSLLGTDISDFKINKLCFDVKMTDINNTKVEISEEAEDAEELDTTGISGSIGGFDDDYDYDDEDYDYDDEDYDYDEEYDDEEYDDEEYDDEEYDDEEDFEEDEEVEEDEESEEE